MLAPSKMMCIGDRYVANYTPIWKEGLHMSDITSLIEKYFPIQSQTSWSDKACLLASMMLMPLYNQSYSYVEIGSYLGGSLTPFLMDPLCNLVLSIDDRGLQLPDERGAKFDYTGVTNQTMIGNLKKHEINTDKLQTFDGSVDIFRPTGQVFDLAFIDGEHTDFGCFRDFLWLLPMMKPDSLVMFHDSTLIYKTLRLIQLYLKKQGISFRFMKKAGSAISIIFFGKLSDIDTGLFYGEEENADDFYTASEIEIINHLIENRVSIQFSCNVIPPKTIWSSKADSNTLIINSSLSG